MQNFYVTFGNNHLPNGNCYYSKIVANDYQQAREKVFKTYGEKWAFIYDESEKAKSIDRFFMQLWQVIT